SRFEARRSDRVAPMVGREQELGLVLERWHQALAGEGQAVLLVGEAGIGKSRLVRAVLDALEGEPHTTLRYQCSPHHTGTALWPVARQLGLAAGLAPGDSDPARLDNLEALLRQGAEDPGEAVPLVAALLGIEAGARHPALELTPQQQRARTLAVLIAQLLGLARHCPVLMVLEDAHWADPTTLELVGQALDQIADARVLMLLTSRPDNQPSLGGHPHVTRLTLNRLGRGPTEAIAARLAGEQGLPAAVLGEIAARADGVPLFVEELTKAVLDTGAAAVIPASLHDSLVARLDRVPGVREVAQAAACLGREFTYPLLAAVSPLPEPELRVALDRLVAAELVFARGEPPEASYAFKHALVRDAAHESLLRGRRRELHARIVRVLEERFSGAADAEPELLARHCAEAGLAERAARHWLRAAELAIGRSANLEAVAHCEMAEAQLRALPSGLERARLELEVLLAKAVAVRAGRGFSAPETEQVFSKACDLCEELGEKIRLMHALRGLFGFYYVTGRWREAGRVAGRLRSEAEGLEDRVALTMSWYLDGVARLFRGEPGEAALRLREALRHCPEGDRDTHIRQGGMDTTTSIRSHLAIAEWLVGRPGGAVGTSGEALEIARRIAHPLSLSQALALGALLRVISRDWTVAEALAIETRETGARYAIPVYVAFGELMAGVATAMRGNATSGVPLARDGMAGLRQTGWQCGVPVLLAHLASSLMAGGDTDAALEAAGEALRMARANGEFCWEAEALRVLAEAKRAAGAEVGEVEAELLAAVDVARQQGARSFELRAATSLARLWRGRGRWSEARDVLTLAYGRFTEGLDTPDLIEARALLDTS
ncbi:MAG: hypothetical protein K0S35_1060, partial [Geminicoccaceae bacterium]|nr:hypothetical protein [Geminicoccaceae bacterium]